ncbi:GATA transcription factor 24-like [Dorcoceras hygrometricum]|uniref:GATA transcription factor 24-like n=1 Tax=Dorcoceras hygrometricum TaxID=472368 RepID=A0A2Z7B2P0_9LAMI|nr:GATA transcription factor 24-like [Dorcoceras hygrometricum]
MSLSVRINGWKDIRRCVEDVSVLVVRCRVEMSGSAVGSVGSDRIQMSTVRQKLRRLVKLERQHFGLALRDSAVGELARISAVARDQLLRCFIQLLLFSDDSGHFRSLFCSVEVALYSSHEGASFYTTLGSCSGLELDREVAVFDSVFVCAEGWTSRIGAGHFLVQNLCGSEECVGHDQVWAEWFLFDEGPRLKVRECLESHLVLAKSWPKRGLSAGRKETMRECRKERAELCGMRASAFVMFCHGIDQARVDCGEFWAFPVTRRDLRVSEYPVEKLRTIPIDLGQNLIYFQMHRRHVYGQQVCF